MHKLIAIFVICLSLSACDKIKESVNEASSEDIAKGTSETTSSDSDSDLTKKSDVAELMRGKMTTHLLLGTGGVTGVYFPIGGVICRLLNRHKERHRMRCSLESTGGSIYNLRELAKGNFDLVVAQSDWQYHAYNGSSTFKKDGANPDLRAVFALEPDPLALIVKKDSDIQSFNDLEKRIVGFGYARSIQHRIIDDLLEVKDWTDKNFKSVVRMNDSHQIEALCNGDVEAVLLISSSLTDRLATADESCEMRFVPITGPEVDAVIAEKPYYRHGRIPRGLYLDSEQDTQSFGLGATFVALKSTSPKAIYQVVKEIVENFKDFQSLHPSLQTLNRKELPYAGISAPLHPGAIRYYREARLMRK